MALRDFFHQSVNQMFPNRLPGTAKGWDESSVNREAILDPDVPVSTEVLPSMAVKLSGRQGQSLWIEPCTEVDDEVFGFVIYKAKNIVNRVTRNQMTTVARHMQLMDFVFKSPVTAGDTVYQDPTDHYCTTNSEDGVYVGVAMETIPATAILPVIATVEIQLAAHGGSEGGGAGQVLSVNGETGNVVLTGENIDATIDAMDTMGRAATTKTITEHLQNLADNAAAMQQEIDTNAGKTAELDADVQGKVDKDQGAENAGKVLKVGEDGNVTLGDAGISAVEWGSIEGTLSDQTDLNDALQNIREVAEGKTNTYVVSYTNNPAFNSQDDTIEITNSFVDVNGVTHNVSDLQQGDNIYVQQLDVPDRWCSIVGEGSATLNKLETTKVVVPTKTSELTNDSGFLTQVDVDATLTGSGTTESPLKVANPIPTDGTEGQVLTKTETGYEWADAAGDETELPDQSGHTGFLQTNGTSVTWNDYINVRGDSNFAVLMGRKSYSYTNGCIFLTDTDQPAAGNQIVIGGNAGGTGRSGTNAVIIGQNARGGAQTVTVGADAWATGDYSIQLGWGRNSTPGTFCVGVGEAASRKNVTLLNASGFVPADTLAADGDAGQVLTKTDDGLTWATPSSGGSDNNGLEGDYATTYGIVDETKSGLPSIVSGKTVKIPAQMVMDIPGVPGLSINSSDITYEIQSSQNCTLFLAQGTVVEATDVFFQIEEPEDGATGYAAWWNGTEWQFKSNDTGNVWRAANAVRIAKCVFTDGSLTRLCFTGCRLLNKQEFATKDEIPSVEGLLSQVSHADALTGDGTSTSPLDLSTTVKNQLNEIAAINSNIDSLYEEMDGKLDSSVAATTYATKTEVGNISSVLDAINGEAI